MQEKPATFGKLLEDKKISRRGFLKFCGMMTAALALPTHYVEKIAGALAAAPRLPVVWLEFQDCTGDTESFLRAGTRPDPIQSGVTDPSLVDLLLDYLSVEYHETIMVPSGANAHKSLTDVMQAYAGQYVCIVEGSIPLAQNGNFCTIRGRTALSILQEVLAQARATVAAGSCSYDGGLAAALPNPTQAVGVRQAVPSAPNLICLPGCPVNVVNLVAALVYFITFNAWPERDGNGLPYFAYGNKIHSRCERKDFYEQKKFVLAWGDAGHQQGWCLYRMGCKGPDTKSNCYNVKWNGGTSWPIGAGHGCIGCTAPAFWDRFTSVYTPLQDD